MELDEDDAISVKKVPDLIKDTNLECNLTFIKSNFSGLTNAILRLEKSGCPLSESIKIFLDIQNKIEETQNEIVSKILNGEEVSKLELPEDLNLYMIYFKFASLTSVYVDRSFSTYKALLADKSISV
ncbi:hypothetical protein QTP88_008375 [Uroleucon formosanum]